MYNILIYRTPTQTARPAITLGRTVTGRHGMPICANVEQSTGRTQHGSPAKPRFPGQVFIMKMLSHISDEECDINTAI